MQFRISVLPPHLQCYAVRFFSFFLSRRDVSWCVLFDPQNRNSLTWNVWTGRPDECKRREEGKSFFISLLPFPFFFSGKRLFISPPPLSRSLAARAKIEMGVTRRGGGGGEEGQEMKAEGPEEEDGRGEGRGKQKKVWHSGNCHQKAEKSKQGKEPATYGLVFFSATEAQKI